MNQEPIDKYTEIQLIQRAVRRIVLEQLRSRGYEIAQNPTVEEFMQIITKSNTDERQTAVQKFMEIFSRILSECTSDDDGDP